MQLFDDYERTESRLAFETEPAFVYLNITARPVIARVRTLLEDWFSHFPVAEQAELRIRLRSPDDRMHSAAFFELAMHEMLLRLRCQVVVHPLGQNEISAKSPDFGATDPDGESFYLEATLDAGQSARDEKTQAVINTVFDGINRKLDSRDFFIGIDMEGAPKSAPSIAKMVEFLQGKLAGLDPDDPNLTSDSGPLWPYDHDGWRVEFFPIPRRGEARNEAAERIIGLKSYGARLVDDITSIKRAVTTKAGRYGELDRPYVIAVNSVGDADDSDVVDALFGREQLTVWFPAAGPVTPIHTEPGRARDGAWIGRAGFINTRVSAALIFHRLNPYSLVHASVCLYHHPKAQWPYQSVLIELPQAIVQNGRLVRVAGASLREILDLPEAWPEDYRGQERAESGL